MPMPDGKVGHAEIKIGDSIVMLADEMDHPDAIAKSPHTLGGVTSGLCLYLADCDAIFNRAVAAGAKVRRPLTNQFYGDRSGTVEDPFGQVWTISTHVEDVPPDEMRRRMEAFAKNRRSGSSPRGARRGRTARGTRAPWLGVVSFCP